MLPAIHEWLRFNGYYYHVPGISYAIEFDGKLLTSRAVGMANLKENKLMNTETRFRVASHSKLFTATAIMELYAEDKLSIDDRVSKHLSWFKPKNRNIRIRHLLTHSSGITRDTEYGQWEHHNFPDLETFKSLLNDKFEILDLASEIKYSNIGYTLLGLIIEKVSGLTYENYMIDLCTRLNLTHTTPSLGDTEKLHATGYKMYMPNEPREPLPHVEAKVMNAATGFSSVPTDMLRFLHALMPETESQLKLDDYYKREMQNVQFSHQDNVKWGFGLSISKIDNTKFVGHGGGYPGFITYSAISPENKLAAAVYTNTLNPPELFGGVIGLLNYADKNYDKYSGKNRDLSKYVGVYRGRWRMLYIGQLNQQLISVPLSNLNPIPYIERLEPTEEDTFIIKEATPLASKGQPVKFLDGELHVGGSIYRRYEYNY